MGRPIAFLRLYFAAEDCDTGQRGRLAFSPRETAGLDVAFEDDESGARAGMEAFYTGPQALDENPHRGVAPAYVTLGLLASRQLGRANVYLNFENITNMRQSRFDPLLRPTPGAGGRRTVDERAPLEGRTVNAGVRVRP